MTTKADSPATLPTAQALRFARDALLSGSAVSIATTLVLSALARAEGRPCVQTINAPSQWYWGERAARSQRIDLAHTIIGYVNHHGASVFWACFYQMLRRLRPRHAPMSHASAIAALAAVVDYAVVPSRLTPGWEKTLTPRSIALAYVVTAFALAASSRTR